MRLRLPIGFFLAALLFSVAAHAADVCATPRQMDGFKTCADVAKAEEEGALTLYSTDPESAGEALLGRFKAMFPKIRTTYLRAQAGGLYAKLLAERQGKVYLADVMQISDMSFAADFVKRGGYMAYVSPEMEAYKPGFKSNPEGFWTWGGIVTAGIAYNPTQVAPADAPKTYLDVYDPKWADSINVKVTISGLQHVTWYMLRNLYGPDYWSRYTALKPRGFDSYVQQFDRLVNGQDKIVMTAQYSGYLIMKAKGAPVEFVVPPEGMIAAPQPYGAIAEAPHPNAARLFLDWFLGVPGQTAMARILYYHSPREDIEPPPGGLPIKSFKLLTPDDWPAFQATHTQYVREWDKLIGLR